MPAGERIGSIGTSRSTDREPGFDTTRVLSLERRRRSGAGRCLRLARRKVNPCSLARPAASRRSSSPPSSGWGWACPRPAAAAAVADSGSALDWIEGELAADGGYLTTSYQGDPDVESFDDWGLTIDAILALAAGGRGDAAVGRHGHRTWWRTTSRPTSPAVSTPPSVTPAPWPRPSSWPRSRAKIRPTSAASTSSMRLLARMQTGGADAGRFSDRTGFGDFSNGFGQALAVLALARTGAVPAEAVDFLLAQQCPGGSFRGDYTTPGGCTDDAAATVDATGFALQALVTLEPTCAIRQAVTDAVESLVAGQNASGAFGGESGSNTNSTGLAAVALRSLGATASADKAAEFVTGLQLDGGDDLGAVALERRRPERGRRRGADPRARRLPPGQHPGGPGPRAADLRRDRRRRRWTRPPSPPASTPSRRAARCPRAPWWRADSSPSSAVGFTPGELVDATVRSTPVAVGTATADADGAVVLTFTVPADRRAGDARGRAGRDRPPGSPCRCPSRCWPRPRHRARSR